MSSLLLLHGLGMSARAWAGVRPLLEPHHDVFAPTLLGHRGGAPPARRPVTIADLVDDVERALDARAIDRPHVAGNSLGGWLAIELARRGRIGTVTALSPAGTWTAGTAEQMLGVRKLRSAIRAARLAGTLPALMRSARVRRFALRDAAAHGERVPAAEAVELSRDLLGCAIAPDLLPTPEELAPLDPLPCPVVLAWSGADRVLPPWLNGEVARQRLPAARFVELPGVGHVPMLDDPGLVARAILATISAATSASSSPAPALRRRA
jgi:pimeloyl-ACP methyl ester carboxylesterase